MSFLNQLKMQAKALQIQQEREHADLARNAAQTERACDLVLYYVRELSGQLNVRDELAKLLVGEPHRFL